MEKCTFVPLLLRVYTARGHERLLPKTPCFLINFVSNIAFTFWIIFHSFNFISFILVRVMVDLEY